MLIIFPSIIQAGSCGLEYKLAHRDHQAKSSDYRESESSAPFWIFIGFIAVFILIMFCKSSDESSRTTGGYNYRGAPTAPPPYTPNPPGFKSEYMNGKFLQMNDVLSQNLLTKQN